MQKHVFRVVLAAMMTAVGLMAFAASAQAVLISHHEIILINGKAAEGVKTLLGSQEGSGTLSIPAKASEIVCEKGEVISATAQNEADTQEGPKNVPIKKLTAKSESGLAAMAQGKVEFSGCKVFTFALDKEGKKIELKESIPCTKAFNEHNKNAKGVVGRPEADALILTYLHLDATGVIERLIVRATQLEGAEQFSTLEFGGTCSLPEKVKVTGGVSGEIPMPTEEGKTVPIKFESETAKGKELNAISETKLLFGASEAYLEGKANAELAEVTKWGVM